MKFSTTFLLYVWPLWLSKALGFSCDGRPSISRRGLLEQIASGQIAFAGALLLPSQARAEYSTDNRLGEDPNTVDSKPYAPVKLLLPATRVKILIDAAVETATELQNQRDNQTKEELISKLTSLLLEQSRAPFLRTEEEKDASTTYLKQRTWGDWKRARQKETQQAFEIKVDPVTSAVEAFEQWGERGQFLRLQKNRIALDKANTMRAAFNAYTNNLVFGSGVKITASKEDKSRLIRMYDQLPDATSTVRSDLDLRDLYRNQVLNAFDDARAELEYQLVQKSKGAEDDNTETLVFDVSEILILLRAAQKSCLDWFAFIPEKDVAEALYEVKHEHTQ